MSETTTTYTHVHDPLSLSRTLGKKEDDCPCVRAQGRGWEREKKERREEGAACASCLSLSLSSLLSLA